MELFAYSKKKWQTRQEENGGNRSRSAKLPTQPQKSKQTDKSRQESSAENRGTDDNATSHQLAV